MKIGCTLDEIIDVVYELYPDYDSIPTEDRDRIFAIWYEANRERYRRMGIDPDLWEGREAKRKKQAG